jgi:hypothetical protein
MTIRKTAIVVLSVAVFIAIAAVPCWWLAHRFVPRVAYWHVLLLLLLYVACCVQYEYAIHFARGRRAPMYVGCLLTLGLLLLMVAYVCYLIHYVPE